MKLKFILDDNYIISHTLSHTGYQKFSSQENRVTLGNFSQLAWDECRTCYELLAGRLMNKTTIDSSLEKAVEKLEHCREHIQPFMKELKESEEYEELRKQVEEYKDYCKEEWNDTYPQAEKLIKRLTGFDLDKEFEIYITHPSLQNGKYWSDNKISWGHAEQWPHYNTVYLWHEVLHSYFGHSHIEHVVLELLTDEELRSELNDEEYPPFKGRKSMDNIKKEILPDWREYKKEGGDIKEFIGEVQSKEE